MTGLEPKYDLMGGQSFSTAGEDAMTGIELIAAERERQILVEGWTAEHDDQHEKEDMAVAAVLYASPIPIYTPGVVNGIECLVYDPWPWDKS